MAACAAGASRKELLAAVDPGPCLDEVPGPVVRRAYPAVPARH